MTNAALKSLAGALLVGALAAQQPLTGLPIPIHTAAPDMGVEYGTWAAADAYKVSFHDGMTFVPYLGSEYPKNQPWSWRTASVKAGATELLEPGIAPSRWHDDYRYEYRYGELTEAYDVLANGLEQTFVIARRPAAGDLVITGAVETALQCSKTPAGHQALTFYDDAGDPIIGYGRAFVFDSAGRRLEITTAFDEGQDGGPDKGQLVLTVPGGWLEAATFPVTVDPLLTPVVVGSHAYNGGQSIKEVDIAYATEVQVTVLAYVRSASQFDDDVIARADSGYFAGVTRTFYADITSNWDSDGASCAFQDQPDAQPGIQSYVAVVFRRYFASNPVRVSRIRAHVQTNTAFLGLQTNVISSPFTYYHNDWRPRIGGYRLANHWDPPINALLVVWQSDDNSATSGHWGNTQTSYVAASLLDPRFSGGVQGSFGPRFTIASSSSFDYERPTASKVLYEYPRNWMCTWQYRTSGSANDDWDLAVRPVNTSGAVVGSMWNPTANADNTIHKLGPLVEGSGGRYLLAYTTTSVAATPITGSTTGQEVWVQRFDWNGTLLPTSQSPYRLDTDTSRRFAVKGVGYDIGGRSHFGVAYSEIASGVRDLHCARLGYRGRPTESALLYSSTGTSPIGGACVYEGDFTFGYGANASVYRRKLEWPQAATPSNVGYGCNTTVQLAWSGLQQIGAEFSGPYAAASAPVGHFLIASLATTDQLVPHPAVFPGCRLLVSNTAGFLGTMAFQYGTNASWTFPLPEWLPPLTLHFQDWVFNGSVFESTQRLSVPIAK